MIAVMQRIIVVITISMHITPGTMKIEVSSAGL